MTYQLYQITKFGIARIGVFHDLETAIACLLALLLPKGVKAVLMHGSREIMTRSIS